MSDTSDGRVEMVHPDLDTVIRPKASKADAYRAGGWVLKSEQPKAVEPAGEEPPTEPAAEAESEPRKRRTNATEKKEA